MLEESNEYQFPEIVDVGTILDVVKGEKELFAIDVPSLDAPIWLRPLPLWPFDDE